MADLDTDPAGGEAFSELEEEFFRAGDAMSVAPTGTWSDLETSPQPKSLWSRLFEREAPAVEPAQTAEPSRVRAATEPANDEEWDWKIAIARARAATHPGM